MGKDDTNQSGDLLPEKDPIFKADFRKRHPFFFISGMIKEIFKAALVLRGVDDDSFFGEGFQECTLGGVNIYIGKERFQNQG